MTVDFGSGNDKAITSYTVTARNNGFNYPADFTLRASTDNFSSSDVAKDTQTGQSFTAAEKKTYAIP